MSVKNTTISFYVFLIYVVGFNLYIFICNDGLNFYVLIFFNVTFYF